PRSAQGSGEDDQDRDHSTSTTGSIHWEGDRDDGGGLSSSTEDEESDSGSECSSDQEMQVDGPSYHGHGSAGESQLVAVSSIRMERSRILTSKDRGGSIHGRLGGCMGDSHQRQGDVQHLERIGTTTPHQLEGVAGHLVLGPPSRNDRKNDSCYLRQHDNDRANQQVWRDEVSTIVGPDDEDMGLLHENGDEDQNDVRPLAVQSSRRTVQEDGYTIGV
ncbi:hypothetical protein BGZ80_008389, partial [Entomortierella chlamydospora]